MKKIFSTIIFAVTLSVISLLFAACPASREKQEDTEHSNTPREEPGDQYKRPNDTSGTKTDTSGKGNH